MKQLNKTIFFIEDKALFARFEAMAKVLAESTFGVPEPFRGNYASCFAAVDVAYRLNISPIVVLQNTRELDGQQTWTYQFVKAIIESCGVIEGELQYEVEGDPSSDGSTNTPAYRVRAYGNTPEGNRINGEWITWHMASTQGWTSNIAYTSMPAVMFRARATTFFGSQYCGTLLAGFQMEHGGNSKAPDHLGAASKSLGLPIKTVDQANAGDIFANALAGATHASTPVLHSAPVPEGTQGQASVQSAEATPTEKAAKPRGRTPKSASVQLTPPPSATTGESTPPPAADTSQAADLLSQSQQDPAGTTEESPIEPIGKTSSEVSPADAAQRFSVAFEVVDSTSQSALALEESSKLIAQFTGDEFTDLLMLLLVNVEKQLQKVLNAERMTQDMVNYITQVRLLHSQAKSWIVGNDELTNRHAAVGAAYKALTVKFTARSASTPSAA